MVFSSATLPLPPVDLDPKLTRLASGTRLYRVHPAHFQGGQFNLNRETTRRGRFHPFTDAQDQVVPTLYAADAIDGALSETVFHNVPGGGGRILRSRLRDLELSCLINRSELLMADLRGHGLRRLGLIRRQLLESDACDYSLTACWAQALHRCNPAIQGLMWISRQFDQATAFVLFGDRMDSALFQVEPDVLALDHGVGYKEVQRIAAEARIAIVE